MSDDLYDDYTFINSVCDDMTPADVLLSLVKECPHDSRRICHIPEVNSWQKMDLKEAHAQIRSLHPEKQKELVEQHRCCSCKLKKE